MFLATIVVLRPSCLSRSCTRAFRISPMFTSAMRTLPWASRSTSSSAARSAGSPPSTSPPPLLQDLPDVPLGDADVAGGVALHVLERGEVRGIHREHQPLRDHRHPVA